MASSKKKNATLLAAQAEYFAKNNIYIEKKEVKKKRLTKHITSETIPASNIGLKGIKDFGIYIENLNNCAKLVDMEDKELVNKILSHYDKVLKYIIRPEIFAEPVKIKEYIIEQGVHQGICRYSRVVLGVIITDREWVTKYHNSNDFWYYIPLDCWTSKELVDCISFRVEKLTEILNELNSEE